MAKEEFLENNLAKLVGGKGEVKSVYGGFHITVKRAHENDFNYAGVLRELLKAGQSVSVEEVNGEIVIVSQ